MPPEATLPRPVCFVIMPFGTKDTRAPAPAPPRVNFDALWEKALRPVIEDLGYQPVRADQDLGALIIKEMLERLYFADLVIADVSIPNGNVYYEVGIRHAAKDVGCVLIGASWATPLFDVDQMRQIRYPLTESDVTEATSLAIQTVLKDSVPKLASGASPMFETLDGYPAAVRAERASVMRSYLDALSAFQTAVRAVRLAPKAEQRARALALKQEYSRPPLVTAVVLELLFALRDCAGWEDVLAYVADMPAALSRLPVVVEQRCLAQSKAGDHRSAIAALEELVATVGPSSERMGLIGGRYKKLAAQELEPREKIRLLSSAIAAYERGMEIDLNDYYPSANLPRLYRQRGGRGDEDRARAAAVVAMMACGRAKTLCPQDEWVRPTLLGMAFDAGDVTAAEDLAEQIGREGAVLWALATTVADLEISVGQQVDADVRQRLNVVLADLRAML